MGRLQDLRNHMDYELSLIQHSKTRMDATAHLYGVSLAAVILAKKRGLDPELAAMSAMMHDIAAYWNGTYEDHARRSADIAREILETLHLASPEETSLVCSAIAAHDDKAAHDGPMEELLKDADVLHHTLHDPSRPVKEKERTRYDALCRELGFK